jgi:hypothetical protein
MQCMTFTLHQFSHLTNGTTSFYQPDISSTASSTTQKHQIY